MLPYLQMFAFHHTALSVSQLSESVRFYRTLGWNEVFRWSADDDSLVICHLKNGDAFLELFCYSKPLPPTHDQSLDADLRHIGVRHLAMRVESVADALIHLRREGIEPLSDIKDGRTGVRYFFVRDPDGIFVEIVEDPRQL
jgi:glyoxylase I family protein